MPQVTRALEVDDFHAAPRSAPHDSFAVAPPDNAERCDGPASNNGLTPPFPGFQEEVPGGGELGLVAPNAQLDVCGPVFDGEALSGSVAIGPASRFRVSTDHESFAIQAWSMTASAPTIVGGIEIDDVRLASSLPNGFEQQPRGAAAARYAMSWPAAAWRRDASTLGASCRGRSVTLRSQREIG